MPGFQTTMTTVIPQDSKLAKTEKNRLRLIQDLKDDGGDEDEEDLDRKESGCKRSSTKKSTIPRYRSKVRFIGLYG